MTALWIVALVLAGSLLAAAVVKDSRSDDPISRWFER
ncbi:membrane protein [Rhodococcus phage GuyFagieri]|nr:membrane protein [Rhodococcus phage GuyFagieri]